MPLYSVIMPAFNAQDTIGEAISSVISQKNNDFELIIVDDCSLDDTFQIAEDAARNDRRIKLTRSPSNSGSPARPRSIGMDLASSKYMAFLDSDDRWHPDKMAVQISAMRDAKAAFSCTGYEVVTRGGEPAGFLVPPANASYSMLLRRNTIGCLTVVYDVEQVGARSFPDCGHEDYALWLELAREGFNVLGIKEILASYTLTPGSVSRNKLRVAKFFWNIYHNREGFSALQSSFMCARYGALNFNKYNRQAFRSR